MLKTFFALILLTTAYSQSNSISIETNIPFHKGKLKYDFDEAGHLLSMVRNDQPSSSTFVYTDNLLTKIIISDTFKSGEIITYDFLYDENKRLIVQRSSKENDTIKFHYDDRHRLIALENWHGYDVQNKYGQESGLLEEKISKNIHPEMSDYYDIIKYYYEPDKITEKKVYYNRYSETRPAVTTREFIGKNLSRKTFYDEGNPGLGTTITDYKYSKSGFLKSIRRDYSNQKFKVTCKNDTILPEVIKKINLILLGDFESMNWY